MKSKLLDAIGLQTHGVALTWADTAPEAAIRFKPGRWGCVVSLIATVATKGRVGAFDRETYGCWGGGIGLGFGNCYQAFPGGIDGFCHFLAQGNKDSDEGRRVGEQVAAWGDAHMTEDFLYGEGYVKSAEATRRFVEALPLRDIPARYVVVKPLEQVDAEQDAVKCVTLFVDPDQLSALVILANYTHPDRENVAVPWAAGCQVMGIFAYRELEREHPRALVGMTDISARLNTQASLGKHVLGFTIPWPLFCNMEENAEGSFLQRRTWRQLRGAAV
jgi:uncharacterized protein (DUF169 family)